MLIWLENHSCIIRFVWKDAFNLYQLVIRGQHLGKGCSYSPRWWSDKQQRNSLLGSHYPDAVILQCEKGKKEVKWVPRPEETEVWIEAHRESDERNLSEEEEGGSQWCLLPAMELTVRQEWFSPADTWWWWWQVTPKTSTDRHSSEGGAADMRDFISW